MGNWANSHGKGDFLYQGCIFDLDGTLVNTLRSIAYFSNIALKRCGYPAIPVEDYKGIVGDGADTQVRRMLNHVASGAWTEGDFRRVRVLYGNLYSIDPTHMLENYPGMPETIAKLKELGVEAAVFSNKPESWVQAIIAFLFPSGSFAECRGQRPGVPIKPSPAGALAIASDLGLRPRDVLYIGDTNTDMKTGAAAGMDTAGAVWGFRTREELAANGAKYLADRPEQIAEIAAGNGAAFLRQQVNESYFS
jgi:phosphoglycolate phosphatase